ncbi:cupin domain-containing protein [Weeksellaceae bacterium TAE3-ERU29]|nr:cupin domain-containing protein [Weeksellaceae bacterium TAE3-ERU29]
MNRILFILMFSCVLFSCKNKEQNTSNINNMASENINNNENAVEGISNISTQGITIKKINIESALASIDELWKLKEIGKVNNHILKMVKLKGDFEMHKHDNGDKLFYVAEGTLFIEFPDKKIIEIKQGECVIIPGNTEHKPFSPEGVSLMMFERE